MDLIKFSIFFITLIQFSTISSGCPPDWKSFVDDQGYPDCFRCRECPDGRTAVENCTKKRDTICDKCTDYEYYDNIPMKCKTCTVCEAGFYVKRNCSRFKDTECDSCPPDTFSLVHSSSNCTQCKDCGGTEIIEGCNPLSDRVCKQNELINGKLIIALLGVAILISVVLLCFCVTHAWRRRDIAGIGETLEMQPFSRFEQDKMKFTYERPIYVREKSDKQICDVTGIEIIPGDRMVVCDRNNISVKLIDTTQNIVTSRIKLPSEPWDIALVPCDITKKSTTHDLVVTLPDKEQLRYIRVTNDQITDTNKVIPVKGHCHGIRVTGDRKLAISYVDYPGRVEIRDLEGQLQTTMETGNRMFTFPQYLAISPGSDILYVSDMLNGTLTSISTRDLSVLEGLYRLRGVTVDRAGSVFVCCKDGTVHLVAATGDRATRILGEEDGLCGSPLAICLSPEGDRMYVSGEGSDHVQEFRLTDKDN